MPRGFAVTLGNVICYARDARPDTPLRNGTLGEHERQHTVQGEVLGPAYLPLHLGLGITALLRNRRWHGAANLLETGPQSNPPAAWGLCSEDCRWRRSADGSRSPHCHCYAAYRAWWVANRRSARVGTVRQ
jgi:hypothetical protein